MNRRFSEGFDDEFDDLWNETEAADDLATDPIPRGVYECRVVSGERFAARSGTPGFKLCFEVLDGDHAGRRTWLNLWLSRNALPYTKRDLVKLGITRPEQLDEQVPAGIVAKAKIIVRENDDGDRWNEVKSFDVLRVEQPEPDPFAPTEDEHKEEDGAAGSEEFEL